MASTLFFGVDHGTAAGTPQRGNPTTGVSNCSLHASDNSTDAYINSTITAGNNSMVRYHWVMFSGTANNINSCRINHVSGVYNAGISLKFQTGTADGSNWYATPSASTLATLTHDLTNTGSASSTGISFLIGPSGAWGGSKQSSSTSLPCWSQYLTFQMQTLSSTSAGNSTAAGNYAIQVSWNES